MFWSTDCWWISLSIASFNQYFEINNGLHFFELSKQIWKHNYFFQSIPIICHLLKRKPQRSILAAFIQGWDQKCSEHGTCAVTLQWAVGQSNPNQQFQCWKGSTSTNSGKRNLLNWWQVFLNWLRGYLADSIKGNAWWI